MDFSELVLVALVDELSEEQEARPYADAIEYNVRGSSTNLESLEEYQGELPIIVTSGIAGATREDNPTTDLEALRAATTHDSVEGMLIDYDTARENEQEVERLSNADVDLIIFYHNSSETPSSEKLLSIVEDAAKYGDVVKIATMAETPADTVSLLSAIMNATSEGITVGGVGMGEVGRHTRVVAPGYGSKLAFAPLRSDADNAAPGQFGLKELAGLVEQVDEVDPDMSLHESITNPHILSEE
ncbi:type I 3-dehydroquinate dehydratase [Halorarum halophilum]|uniref:3-dehydroquinate dehydratase n=1 Tax=Halorarum halophilum TaxID=2743090 RepID=A0A7D5KH87_9EURY|nr:type I 3-dehydroquinate dehydratase [Halobaculum halophilum]QLG28936.1 type I 3-dehydroquinate dehydratase [Halobaculum halophilum]